MQKMYRIIFQTKLTALFAFWLETLLLLKTYYAIAKYILSKTQYVKQRKDAIFTTDFEEVHR